MVMTSCEGISQTEIDVAARDCLRYGGRRHIYVPNIGEPFRPQQFLGDKLRSNADRRLFSETNCSYFGRCLGGQHSRRADEARRTGQ